VKIVDAVARFVRGLASLPRSAFRVGGFIARYAIAS
jgi:hypothetical protein